MSNKILISFLGTGDSKNREYKNVTYSLEGKEYESTFVAAVISEHFIIPNKIIIGTAKSMWEELYRYYCERNKININEDYYVKLADLNSDAGHTTKISTIELKNVEAVLGGNSKCIIVPYGLNRVEQLEILSKISTALDEMVSTNDEIILDITHSFRSLPLYSTAVINYLNDVKNKGAKIAQVLYGMLDAMKEFGNVAPIIDISSTIELNNWSKAAHAFKEYGKGYLLSDLIQGDEAKMVKMFSDAVGMNYLNDIRLKLTNFKELVKIEEKNEIAGMILPQVIESFVSRLQRAGNINYLFQLELCKWHLEMKNYSSAFTVFVESMLTFICELEGMDWKDIDDRESAKALIKLKYSTLFEIYRTNNIVRNYTVHSIDKKAKKIETAIDDLTKGIIKFEKIAEQIYK